MSRCLTILVNHPRRLGKGLLWGWRWVDVSLGWSITPTGVGDLWIDMQLEGCLVLVVWRDREILIYQHPLTAPTEIYSLSYVQWYIMESELVANISLYFNLLMTCLNKSGQLWMFSVKLWSQQFYALYHSSLYALDPRCFILGACFVYCSLKN